jgi:hypothetical protein
LPPIGFHRAARPLLKTLIPREENHVKVQKTECA